MRNITSRLILWSLYNSVVSCFLTFVSLTPHLHFPVRTRNSTALTTKATAFFAMKIAASYLCQMIARNTKNGRLLPIISNGPRNIDVLFLSFTSPFFTNLFRSKPNGDRRKEKQAKRTTHISKSLPNSKSPSFCIRNISNISMPSKRFNAANTDNNNTGFR